MPLSELRALSWGYPEQLSWHLRHLGSQFPTISSPAGPPWPGKPHPLCFPSAHQPLSVLGCQSAPKRGQNCSDFAFLSGKVGAANAGWRIWDGQGGNSILLATGASSAAQSTETNELEEAFPLPRALTRELRGQELKNEEERKRDRKIHLPSRNPQSRGHLEVIFHRAESCFWPFSRHYFLLKPHRFGCWEVFPPSSGCWKSSIALGAGLNFHTLLCVLG